MTAFLNTCIGKIKFAVISGINNIYYQNYYIGTFLSLYNIFKRLLVGLNIKMCVDFFSPLTPKTILTLYLMTKFKLCLKMCLQTTNVTQNISLSCKPWECVWVGVCVCVGGGGVVYYNWQKIWGLSPPLPTGL